MPDTPQPSPTKSSVSQSSSQEDIKGYEIIDDMPPMHEEEEEDHPLSDEILRPDTQIKLSQSSQGTMDFEPVSPPKREQTRTPDLKKRRSQKEPAQPSPVSPGRLAPFDWSDFQHRYQKALADADQQESELLEEFEQLVKYFQVWASASSSHDNERAVKRLQTRTRYVHLSEENLKQKKQHLTEVVKAFKSALALLSTAR